MHKSNYDNCLLKRLKLHNMTREQLDRLHTATLRILEQAGIKVCDPEAIALLHDAGAFVSGDLVKIPAWMVEQSLQTAPSKVVIYDRSGNRAMSMEKGRVYFGTGSATPFIIDIDSGERRRSIKKDTINATIIADALENIDFVMSMVRASDVADDRSDRHHFEAMTLNSAKPIVFDAHDREGLLDILKMASLATGSRSALVEKPYIIHYSEPSSPLVHTKPALQKLLTAADEKIPTIYAPAVMCGATGPVTTAGALALANAETLSGLVMHQLRAKGAPFIYGGGTPSLNMITTVCSYGDPQSLVGWASLVQLADYYDLPSFTIAGCTDAHTFDQQAAMEAGLSLLLSSLAGGNLVHDLGYMGAGLTYSLEYLVLCNEAAGAIKYMLRGVDIDADTLALDVIESVGPGGHFLTEQHTMDFFRSQMHFTGTLNRNTHANWLAAGSKSFGENARARIKEILQWHEVPLLAPEIEREIKELVLGSGGRRELA